MADYNPSLPEVAGDEWVPIDEQLLQFPGSNRVFERGYSFTLPETEDVYSGRYYIRQWNELAVAQKYRTVNVYQRGKENDTGPIQRVVIPVNAAEKSGSVVTTLGGGGTTGPDIVNALFLPNKGNQLFITAGTGITPADSQCVQLSFAMNRFANLLTGKRILAVNFLVSGYTSFNGVTPPQDPGAVYDIAVSTTTQAIATWAAQAPSISDPSMIPFTPNIMTADSTEEVFQYSYRIGAVNTYWQNDTAGVYNNFYLRDWTFVNGLDRFEATHAHPIKVRIDHPLVSTQPAKQLVLRYAAMEVFFCEENRVANGSRVQTRLVVLGANDVPLQDATRTNSVVVPHLTPGDYTVTFTTGNDGDDAATTDADHYLNQLRQLYAISNMPGVQVNLPTLLDSTSVGKQAVTVEDSDLIPEVTLHRSDETPIPATHVYGQQVPIPVYNGNSPYQNLVNPRGDQNTEYSWIRFYARKFNSVGPLSVFNTNATASAVPGVVASAAIGPTEFDALEELIDGWKEVTLKFDTPIIFPFGPVTDGALSLSATWQTPIMWEASQDQIGSRWEILAASAPAASGILASINLNNQVPSTQQLSKGTYGYFAYADDPFFSQGYGYAADLTWYPQTGPFINSPAADYKTDAVVLLGSAPPAPSGFAVQTLTQPLEQIGLGCTPINAIPTGLMYNQLTWDQMDSAVVATFGAPSVTGWGPVLSSNLSWCSFNDYGSLSVSGNQGLMTHLSGLAYADVFLMNYAEWNTGIRFAFEAPPQWQNFGSSATAKTIESIVVYIRSAQAPPTDAQTTSYQVVFNLETDGSINTTVNEVSGGVVSLLNGGNTFIGGLPMLKFNVAIAAQNNVLSVKIWSDVESEPTNWLLTTILPAPVLTTTVVGLQTRILTDSYTTFLSGASMPVSGQALVMNRLNLAGGALSPNVPLFSGPALDFRIEATINNLSLGSERTLGGRWDTTSNKRSWILNITAAGKLEFLYSANGTAITADVVSPNAIVPDYTSNGHFFARVTFVGDDGLNESVLTFYQGASMDGPWTQLGAATIGTRLDSLYQDYTIPTSLGGYNFGAFGVPTGEIHAARLYDGVGGPILFDTNFRVNTDDSVPGQRVDGYVTWQTQATASDFLSVAPLRGTEGVGTTAKYSFAAPKPSMAITAWNTFKVDGEVQSNPTHYPPVILASQWKSITPTELYVDALFGTPAASGWGTPDVGPPFVTVGGQPSVAGGFGVMTMPVKNAFSDVQVGKLTHLDAGVWEYNVGPTSVPVSGIAEASIVLRGSQNTATSIYSGSKFVVSYVDWQTNGTATVFVKDSAGGNLGSATIPGVTAGASIDKFTSVQGRQVRVWAAPHSVGVDLTQAPLVDVTTTVLTPGVIVAEAFVSSTTVVPVTFRWDEIKVLTPQTIYSGDSFDVPVAASWGTPNTGPAWQVLSTAGGSPSVSGGFGRMTMTVPGSATDIQAGALSLADVEVSFQNLGPSGTPTGSFTNSAVFLRVSQVVTNSPFSALNYVLVFVEWETNGTATLKMNDSRGSFGQTTIPGVTTSQQIDLLVVASGSGIYAWAALSSTGINRAGPPLMSATTGVLTPGTVVLETYYDTGSTGPRIMRWGEAQVRSAGVGKWIFGLEQGGYPYFKYSVDGSDSGAVEIQSTTALPANAIAPDGMAVLRTDVGQMVNFTYGKTNDPGVAGNGQIMFDLFDRTVASGWGTASVGLPWVPYITQAAANVSSLHGHHTISVANTARVEVVGGFSSDSFRFEVKDITPSATAVGAPIHGGIYTNGSLANVSVFFEWETDGTIRLQSNGIEFFNKLVPGVTGTTSLDLAIDLYENQIRVWVAAHSVGLNYNGTPFGVVPIAIGDVNFVGIVSDVANGGTVPRTVNYGAITITDMSGLSTIGTGSNLLPSRQKVFGDGSLNTCNDWLATTLPITPGGLHTDVVTGTSAANISSAWPTIGASNILDMRISMQIRDLANMSTAVIGVWDAPANKLCYRLLVNASAVTFNASSDGINTTVAVSPGTDLTTIIDSNYRVTIRCWANPATGVVNFYYNLGHNINGPWTLWSTTTIAAWTFFASNSPLWVGMRPGGLPGAATYNRAQVYFQNVLKADANFSVQETFATTFVDYTNNTWTPFGTAYLNQGLLANSGTVTDVGTSGVKHTFTANGSYAYSVTKRIHRNGALSVKNMAISATPSVAAVTSTLVLRGTNDGQRAEARIYWYTNGTAGVRGFSTFETGWSENFLATTGTFQNPTAVLIPGITTSQPIDVWAEINSSDLRIWAAPSSVGIDRTQPPLQILRVTTIDSGFWGLLTQTAPRTVTPISVTYGSVDDYDIRNFFDTEHSQVYFQSYSPVTSGGIAPAAALISDMNLPIVIGNTADYNQWQGGWGTTQAVSFETDDNIVAFSRPFAAAPGVSGFVDESNNVWTVSPGAVITRSGDRWVTKFDDIQISPGPGAGDGSYVEIQRMDDVEPEWKTIMKTTNLFLGVFNDYEARIGVPTYYRIRRLTIYGFEGDWSPILNVTIPKPGITGPGSTPGHVLAFSSNERQDGSVNLAYFETFEGTVEEAFNFPEAGFVQQQLMYNKDFFTAFSPLERGGETFTREILVQAAAIPPETLADFTSLRDMAWDHVSYICVRDEDGNRWLTSVQVPSGRVRHYRKLYQATVQITEVTDTPSPVSEDSSWP